MRSIISKIKYTLKRHPILHKIRWFMVTKGPDKTLFLNESYNTYNKKEDI